MIVTSKKRVSDVYGFIEYLEKVALNVESLSFRLMHPEAGLTLLVPNYYSGDFCCDGENMYIFQQGILMCQVPMYFDYVFTYYCQYDARYPYGTYTLNCVI